MSSPNKVWFFEDYDKCIVALTNLKQKNFKSLPQINSKKSSQYFQRLVSDQNLLFINDTTAEIQKRVFQLQYLSSNFGKLLLLYYQFDGSKQFYSKEIVELYIFGLKINRTMFDFAKERFLKKKELNDQMKLGFQNMKNGYKTMIIGLLMELENKNSYNIEDLEKLSTEIKNNVLSNIEFIEPESKIELKEKLIKISETQYSDTVNNNILTLIKNLDQAGGN